MSKQLWKARTHIITRHGWCAASQSARPGALLAAAAAPCARTWASMRSQIKLGRIGGGFAGLHAAIHLDDTLARDPDLEITLVNRDNFFLFTPMLHEVAASDIELTHIVNPVRKLLKRVNVVAGDVD